MNNMIISANVSINNVPAYAENKKYIVARFVDGSWWFWGAWDADEKEVAYQAASEQGGAVFENA